MATDDLVALEARFHEAMLDLDARARKVIRHPGTRTLQMIRRYGGLETAKRLICLKGEPKCFTDLCVMRRLDLTIEALILNSPQFHQLFEEHELDRVRQRLQAYEYPPAME